LKFVCLFLHVEKEERITVPSSSTNYTLKDLTVDKLYLVKIAPILNNGRIGQWSNSKPVLFAGKTAKAVGNYLMHSFCVP
jgi:hypothetical protein